MNSNASPPAPSPSSNGGQNGSRAAAVAAGAGGPAITYRPRGVVQVISFNAGKALGKAAGGRREDDGNGIEREVFVMWRQGPIWEPKDSSFRPYSITTLIFFYIGKFFGRLFRTRA